MLFSAKWLAVVTVAICSTVLIVYFAGRNREQVTFPDNDIAPRQSRPVSAVCNTPACQEDAQLMLQYLNKSVDPCVDFYNYACGGWRRDNPLPTGKKVIWPQDALTTKVQEHWQSILEEPISADDPDPVNTARKMYNVCMDEEQVELAGLQPLVDLTNELGGWPMILEHWEGEHYRFMDVIVNIKKRLNISPIISFKIMTDMVVLNHFDNGVKILDVDLGVFGNILLTPDNTKKELDIYKNFIKNTVFEIMNKTGVYRNDQRVQNDIEKIVKFEESLKLMQTLLSQLYNVSGSDMLLSTLESGPLLSTSFKSQYNLLNLLNQVLSDIDITLPDGERVLVEDSQILVAVIRMIELTPTRVVANTVLWRVVQEVMQATTKDMRKIKHDFLARSTYIQPKSLDTRRNIICSKPIKENLKHAFGYKYVHKNFNMESKLTLENFVKNIRSAFNSRVTQAQWLDDEAKEVIIEKADAMTAEVAFPDWYNNASALEDYYKEVKASNVYFQNYITLRRIDSQLELRKNLSPVGRKGWDEDPFDVLNAHYSGRLNLLNVPAVHWQPPFYRDGGHEALNYGGIGTFVGHEIAHGFCTEGRQYDKYGYFGKWWPNSMDISFKQKASCIIQQYSSVSISYGMRGKVEVNGTLTLSENIADNGGLNMAYLAYQQYLKQNGPDKRLPGLEDLSPNQLFFISFARNWCASESIDYKKGFASKDVHPPHIIRGFVPLINSEDFGKAFNCPIGSRMNPQDKCILW